MKIRITGTEQEIAAIVPLLRAVLEIQELSAFYANRGESQLGRVYLEVKGPRPDGAATVQAAATRTDREHPALGTGRRQIRS